MADLARSEALDDDVAYRLDLCLAEVVSNIVRHGLAAGGGEPVRVSAEREGADFRVVVVDDGRPFDLLAHPLPPAPPQLEDLEPGGFGIPIVRGLADHLESSRRDGHNRLVLGFRPRLMLPRHPLRLLEGVSDGDRASGLRRSGGDGSSSARPCSFPPAR